VLGEDQADALTRIAVSGRVLDVLVGPAGAGKTTAMNALRRAWEAEHGTGSVVGLAPSAVAAQVLADDLGIETENTAMWWQNHLTKGLNFQPGQLVIVDEASLAGTFSFDRVTGLAQQAGRRCCWSVTTHSFNRLMPGARSPCSPATAPTPSNSSTSTASNSRGRSSPPSICATATPA
jgi:energy-coupling factor transporter ATP-binding protein EcfA2